MHKVSILHTNKMDPFRNRQGSLPFTNYNNNNIEQAEEKHSPDQQFRVELSDRARPTLSAQYIMQQRLIEQLQNEQRLQRQGFNQQHLLDRLQEDERQDQLVQLLQSRRREAQLRQLQDEQLLLLQRQQQRPRVGIANVTAAAAAAAAVSSTPIGGLMPSTVLGMNLQQRRRQQEQLLQQEELHRLQLQRLLQQQQNQRNRDIHLSDELQHASQFDPLLLGNLNQSELNAARLATLPIRRDFHSATNIAAPDFSLSDFARVGTGLHNINATRFASRVEAAAAIPNPDTSEAATMLYPWSETSAELLQHMQMSESKSGTSPSKKKSTLRKKIVGMPKRPLHAYNIFFQEERKRVLSELPSPPEAKGANLYVQSGKRKRRRRATHGKISFASLAKGIGEKWQGMKEDEKVHYQKLAEQDLKRYHDEMEVYNAKLKDSDEKSDTKVDGETTKQNKGDIHDESMDGNDKDDDDYNTESNESEDE